MLDAFFESDRNRLVGVWARDTLGLSTENYGKHIHSFNRMVVRRTFLAQKVQTVKDLSVIWNAPAGLPPPVKIQPPPPMAILTDDPTTIPGYDPTKPLPDARRALYTSAQLMPGVAKDDSIEADRTGYFETPQVKLDDPIPGLSTKTASGTVKAVPPAPPSGLYSALNTLLLDDSALKAHLQPYNHLTLPEYTAELRTRDVRRRDAINMLTQLASSDSLEGDGKEAKGDGLAELRDATRSDTQSERTSFLHTPSSRLKLHVEPSDDRSKYKYLRASPFDKTLIAVIGVLDAVRYESSLVGWMRSGGMRPSAEELARLAALFAEAAEPPVIPHGSAETTCMDEVEQMPLSKHSIDSLSDGEQTNAKRRRLESIVAESSHGAGREGGGYPPPIDSVEGLNGGVPAFAEVMTVDPSLIPSASQNDELAALLQFLNPTITPIPELPNPEASSTILNEASAQAEGGNVQLTKRKRQRMRQKPTFPVDHPLGANDFYPFFTDGKPETKLWFQEREIYAYWVRRGLLALRECGIEPDDGVDISQ